MYNRDRNCVAESIAKKNVFSESHLDVIFIFNIFWLNILMFVTLFR